MVIPAASTSRRPIVPESGWGSQPGLGAHGHRLEYRGDEEGVVTTRRTKAPRRGKKTSTSKAARAKKSAKTKAKARKATPKRSSRKATRKASSKAASPSRRAPARRKQSGATKRRTGTRTRAFRLAGDVAPHAMDIHVSLDPARGDRFSGEVGIELSTTRRRRTLELHAVDLRVSRARLRVGDTILRGRIHAHPDRQSIEIEFRESFPPGAYRLELGFAGKLRKDLCGLYAATSGGQRYAFTQLEAADARKFFPCFDEPDKKVRFQLSVTTAASHRVVSNMPVERVEPLPAGQKTVHFARSPLLSTYLAALAVGDLECSEAAIATATPIRVWHVPGQGHLTAFALEAARETLVRLEDYFGLPYPYPKLDLVAVPDFEFGAMENPGAVFFRETLLLMDPETVTLAEKKRAAEVICHELAHMWYGDLVTMRWWDDLWLNEAFATWMAFEIVNQWKPEWLMWHDFQHHRAAALELDALANTHPIYTEVRTPEEASENFDVITYEKGASVVRMLERYLGPETFRAGVRTYIQRHRESNTVAADLWNALGEASGEKIEPTVRAWIEQPGYPVVTLRVVREGRSRHVELHQQRFVEVPTKGGVRPRWPIPIVLRAASARRPTKMKETRQLFSRVRERSTLKLPAKGFVYGNADEGGFYRPRHEGELLTSLLANLESLETVERLGFVDHQWALTRAGRAKVVDLMEVLALLGTEHDPDVLAGARRPLSFLGDRLARSLGAEVEDRYRAWVSVYYGAQADELGWQVRKGENDGTRLRRAAVLAIVGGAGRASRVLQEASERCRAYLGNRRAIDPDLADVAVALAATVGDSSLHDRFREACRKADTPQEARRFLLALGDFREPELIARTLDLSLTEEVATQDVVFLLVRLFSNPEAAAQTWEFVQRRWSDLRERMPSLLAGRLISATPALGTASHAREVERFFRRNRVPSGARALDQALERFRWYGGFLARSGPEFASFLEG